MITVGSVSRGEIAEVFPFLAEKFRGRRSAIKELTHSKPDFVFWVFPDGRLYDAKDAHIRNVPKGYSDILKDEPDYGGFLRGRIVTSRGKQLVVVYCRPEALATPGGKLIQFMSAMRQLPIPLLPEALVISDNADIYGTLRDLDERERHAVTHGYMCWSGPCEVGGERRNRQDDCTIASLGESDVRPLNLGR